MPSLPVFLDQPVLRPRLAWALVVANVTLIAVALAAALS
jgi:hypothetical protein